HIVTPLEESPAWKAGIMAGDTVLKIDGKSTQDLKLHQAVKMISGKAGTKVTLRVRHPSGDKENITITRQLINVRTVRGFNRNANQKYDYFLDTKRKIGYIRISQFTDDTAKEMNEVLKELTDNKVKGII